MKKQIWIKIIVNVFLLISIISCVCLLVMYINYLIENFQDLLQSQNDPWTSKTIKDIIERQITYSIFLSINLIADVIIFISLNFKDASYLTSSLFKKWNDGKAQREVEQKEKKQAKLEAEIAERQAMLDEMKKE